MAEAKLLANMYHAIMLGFVQTGRAPHYVDLARLLGLRSEESRRALHQLVVMGLPNWLVPDTDYIASFAPFSNGQQQWYAQCGLESLAISWLFPGKEIRIDCSCFDCTESINIRMRDGELLSVEPPTVVGPCQRPGSTLA